METGSEVTAVSECTFHSLKRATCKKATKILQVPTGPGPYAGGVQGIQMNRPLCGRGPWKYMRLHGTFPPCMVVAMVGLWLGFGLTTLSQTKCAHEVVR